MDLQFFIDSLPSTGVKLSDESVALLPEALLLAAAGALCGASTALQHKQLLEHTRASVASMHPLVWRVRQAWALLVASLCFIALAASRSWLLDWHLALGLVIAVAAVVSHATAVLVFEYLMGVAWVVVVAEITLDVHERPLAAWLKVLRLLASSLLFLAFLVRNTQLKRLQTIRLGATQLFAVLCMQELAYVGCLITSQGDTLVVSLLQNRYAAGAAYAFIHVLYHVILAFMTGHSGVTVRARPTPSNGRSDEHVRTDLPSDSIEITEAEALRLLEQRKRPVRSRR